VNVDPNFQIYSIDKLYTGNLTVEFFKCRILPTFAVLLTPSHRVSMVFTNRKIMVDEVTKKQLASIPLLKTKAGPRDGELWVQRLKEEYQSLIKVSWRFKEFPLS
jgi:hypothetical protein